MKYLLDTNICIYLLNGNKFTEEKGERDRGIFLGNIIEDFDILIASIAFTNNYILVTNNPKHFQRIKELQIENWIP